MLSRGVVLANLSGFGPVVGLSFESTHNVKTFLEFFLQLTMNDFSVHRIIGRGGFGEVYGCRKADTGKMYAMKCLDKKRIKMKQGETLALNERIMLSLVSTGVSLTIILSKIIFNS